MESGPWPVGWTGVEVAAVGRVVTVIASRVGVKAGSLRGMGAVSKSPGMGAAARARCGNEAPKRRWCSFRL